MRPVARRPRRLTNNRQRSVLRPTPREITPYSPTNATRKRSVPRLTRRSTTKTIPNQSPAYFIMVGTFGKRVPGDRQGAYRANGEYVASNEYLEKKTRGQMTRPIIVFDDYERKLAFSGIADSCYQHGIIVDALNVQIDHFHLLAYSTTKTADEIYGMVVRAASHRLNVGSPRFSELKKIWQLKYDARDAYGSVTRLRYMKHTLEEQTNCDYMNRKEWLRRSSIWKSDPFDERSNRRVEFDGRLTTLVESELAVKRTKPEEVMCRTKWD